MSRSELPVDCAAAERNIERDTSVAANYFPFELQTAGGVVGPAANSQNNNSFFCFADGVAGGYPANAGVFPGAGCQIPQVEFIDGGNAFCEAQDELQGQATPRHRAAFVIRGGDHDFYGGEVGNWSWNSGIFPSFVPDGIGFWARSDPEADKFITVYLNDYNTGAPSDTVPGTRYSPTLANIGLEAGCMPTASGAGQMTTVVAVGSSDPNVQTSVSDLLVVQPKGLCGNRWRRLLQTTENWQLYLLPFDTFYQDPQPHRTTSGIQTSYDLDPNDDDPPKPSPFYSIAFNFARGTSVSLWIDEIFFYRRKPAATAD